MLPISALFIIAATGYFSLNYDLSKALKLGVLSGFLIATALSLVMATILFITRQARATYVEKHHPEQNVEHEMANGPIDKTFFLLMDKSMAFDIAIQSIIDQHIGEVSKDSRKKKGTITVFEEKQRIKMHIDTLTKHTTKVSIAADAYSEGVQKIINYIKTKEHSFLQY